MVKRLSTMLVAALVAACTLAITPLAYAAQTVEKVAVDTFIYAKIALATAAHCFVRNFWCFYADQAFQTQYRQEFVAAFEAHQSLLREVVTNEADVKGNVAVFLVIGSGGAVAQTRGINGLIPSRSDSNTQNSCTLSEWHDLVRKTNFNIEASQGNQRAAMQMTSMAVINRKIDDQIITELAAGTVSMYSRHEMLELVDTFLYRYLDDHAPGGADE